MRLEQAIIERAKSIGFDLAGISRLEPSQYRHEVERWVEDERHGSMRWYEKHMDRRIDPQGHLYGQAVSAITLGLLYRPADIPDELRQDPSRGLIARYARYDDYHQLVGRLLTDLAESVSQLVSDWHFVTYVDTGPVLEREVGARGGLGFIGKNTTLINPAVGSYFFLAEIICDLPLEPTPSRAEGGTCGQCRRCAEACPTQAIISPYQLDARRCISYLTIENRGPIPLEFRPLMKNLIYGCDICQEVCPWNKRLPADLLSRLTPRPELIAPRLLDLIALDENGFEHYFAGTPVLRTKYRGFIRNVLVALGNWGDRQALAAVDRRRTDPDELIVEHAEWAWSQIRKRAGS